MSGQESVPRDVRDDDMRISAAVNIGAINVHGAHTALVGDVTVRTTYRLVGVREKNGVVLMNIVGVITVGKVQGPEIVPMEVDHRRVVHELEKPRVRRDVNDVRSAIVKVGRVTKRQVNGALAKNPRARRCGGRC